jgi:carbamoyltransferase
LDFVAFYEKPLRKFNRILTTILQTYPRSYKLFREAMTLWMLDKLWVEATIASNLRIPKRKIVFCDHHLSHAASTFLCSPFHEAAILTVDGVGEWATSSWGVGRDNCISLKQITEFPHSIGLLYSAFTAFLGFEVNEGEYKVMGMASYGEPRYADQVSRVIRQEPDGSFSLDMDYFCFHHSTERSFNDKFVGLFGEPRDSNALFFTANSGFPLYFGARPARYQEQCERNQRYADIAASLQYVTENVLLGMARKVHAETGLNRLCIAGGVALNSVANSRILHDSPFDELFIQPAAGDDGGALGAALWADNIVLGNSRRFRMEHAFWGQSYDSPSISAFIEREGIHCRSLDDDDQLIHVVADALQRGKVIGWFQGSFEWGPRALGNRSILADPRDPGMKDIVNTKVKFREPYRPFAPSVLAECAETYFDLPDAAAHHPARYMLFVTPVRPSCRHLIPAVTHIDGTSRLQTVFRDTNPRFHKLIQTFGQATGVPAVLNTSFNLKGEPIVNTPADAFSTFLRSGIDMLVLGNIVVDKGDVGR